MVSLQSPVAHKKGLELILLLGGNLPERIQGNQNGITRLLDILINLAIQLTDNGHVFIEADCTEHEDRQELHIRVSDTGTGLSQEQHEQLFQASPRADNSSTGRPGEKEPGLATSKRLVTLLGGRVSVKSQIGRGSEYSLSVPIHSLPAGNRMTGCPSPLSGRRILVYDAHPLSRRTLRATLLHWGMIVFNTGDIARLLSLLADQEQNTGNFDLVLISLSPKQSSGQDFLFLHTHLRDIYRGPILYLAGSEDWRPPTLMAGSRLVNWQSKPARRSILQQNICELLSIDSVSNTSETQESSEASSPGDISILVAEDNEFNRLLLKKLLEDRGITVCEAGSGEDAVKIAQHHAFDLILMDIHMPGLDGISAAQQIRTILGEQCPPIVSQTADVFPDTVTDNGRQVFDDKLIKPVKPKALEGIINHWILKRNRLPPTRTGALAEISYKKAGFVAAPADDSNSGPNGINSSVPEVLRARLYEEIRRSWAEMKDFQEQMRWKELADLAHQFSGLCGLYGISELTVLARDLEQYSRNEAKLSIPSTMKLLDTIITSLHEPHE